MATILEIKKLTKDFVGLRALHDVDMKLGEGEILGLIGPNGSGKTTLLNVITGFLPPTAGSIVYKGESIGGLKPHVIAAKRIIRTFQITSIFGSMSTRDNVIAGRHLKVNDSLWGSFLRTRGYRREQAKLIQKAAEILAFIKMSEKGNIIAKNLGLGEQKRLEIAIALSAEPELLLLDEPAAGLNPTEAVEMIDLLRSLRATGITLVVVEHNMRVIMQLCDRIVVFDYGVKIAEGVPEEIATSEKVIQVYLGSEESA